MVVFICLSAKRYSLNIGLLSPRGGYVIGVCLSAIAPKVRNECL